ncbi:unnamed protein product [Paramecium octaurelia]|uniref:LITAF domain-containing protein n=1 Tax=Paramecium octaurelia TaxID=43137 RepID=A0A8S1VCU4_PAROT|nr:unnamed protein product [Paramecium octaurelia]
MDYNQNNQYGQVSGQQGGYPYFQPQPQPLNQYNQPYPQPPYQPPAPYLDPNIPVGQPVGQPQYGNYQQQPVYSSGFVQNGPVYTASPVLRSAEGMRFPVQIQCPYCNQQGITRIENRVGDGTICASILVLIFCWPLFWLPCCLEDCKDRVHLCIHCQKCVGKKRYEIC